MLVLWLILLGRDAGLSLGRSVVPNCVSGEALRGGICPGGLREENVVIGLGVAELRAAG